MNSVAERLQYLCNKYGDFKVAKTWKDSSGETQWSKHRSVMECWESEWGIYWLGQVSHRQILPIEIVIDIDENPTLEKLNWICERLEIMGCKYIAYNTGSKGFHIHIKDKLMFDMTKEQKAHMRLRLLEVLGADLHKKDEVLIALEDVPHWKTGNIKKEIRRSENWESF